MARGDRDAVRRYLRRQAEFGALRVDTRPARSNGLGSEVKAGGALLAPDRTTVLGSPLILEGEDDAEIAAMLAEESYVRGLFTNVDIKLSAGGGRPARLSAG